MGTPPDQEQLPHLPHLPYLLLTPTEAKKEHSDILIRYSPEE